MNSFNHFAFGAIGEWMVRTIAGLNLDPDHPGWKHFYVRPIPPPQGGISYAKATYRSIHGYITVSWRIEEGRFLLDLTVPANTWATVEIPTRDAESVKEGGWPAGDATGITAGSVTADTATFSVRAGTYHFSAKAR